METNYEQQITKLNEEIALQRKQFSDKEQDLSEKEAKAQEYIEKESQLKQEKEDLIERLENEKNLRLEQVNQKELDRIKETEQLRKEMLFNIKKTKANLLAMNDKQLQTTTHLTIL